MNITKKCAGCGVTTYVDSGSGLCDGCLAEFFEENPEVMESMLEPVKVRCDVCGVRVPLGDSIAVGLVTFCEEHFQEAQTQYAVMRSAYYAAARSAGVMDPDHYPEFDEWCEEEHLERPEMVIRDPNTGGRVSF